MSVRFLGVNDVETALDDPELTGRLAGLIDARRNGRTVVVNAGDVFSPGVLAMAGSGEHALAFLDAVAPDVHALGNHDFVGGADLLPERMATSPGQWLTANVWQAVAGERGGERHRRFAPDETAPWAVLTVGDDEADAGVETTETVGAVGVANPDTAEIDGGLADTDLAFGDPVAAVADAFEAMPTTDYRVVVSHCGDDAPIARAVDVDVVFGGHIHERRCEVVDGTLLVRTSGQASSLVEVELESGDAASTDGVEFHEPPAAPRDEELITTLRDLVAATGFDDPLGQTDRSLSREGARRGRSSIGSFVADAFRWATDADVALVDAAAIRSAPPLDGDVTLFDYLRLVPYRQDVVVFSVTGRELRAAVESRVFGERGIFPLHISGGSIGWSGTDLADLQIEGKSVDESNDERYELATLEYVAFVESELPMLSPEEVVRQTGPQYELVESYVRAVGLCLEDECENRVRFE